MQWTKLSKTGYSTAYAGKIVYSVVAMQGGGFSVTRNGVEIAGPNCVGAPAGFKTLEAAQAYAESVNA